MIMKVYNGRWSYNVLTNDEWSVLDFFDILRTMDGSVC